MFDAPQFHPALRGGKVPSRTSHLFFAALTDKEAAAHVQFFVGPDNLPPPSRVKLATNPLLLDAKVFACHHAAYRSDGEDRSDGHDGDLLQIDVFERRIVQP